MILERTVGNAKLKITLPISFLLILLLISCSEERRHFEIRNLNDNTIGILGHRGMGKGSGYPDNTLESIGPALRIGADGTEIDVQITKDSVLVVFHDKELSDKTSCKGLVRDHDWAEIEQCAYDTPLPQDIHVISVDTLFSRIPAIQNYYFSFDCKFNPKEESLTTYFRQFIYTIEQVIDKYNMHNKVMIEAGDIQFLQMLKQSEVQALSFVTGKDITEALRIAEELDLYGIGIGSSVTRKDIELAHDRGFRVMTWMKQ